MSYQGLRFMGGPTGEVRIRIYRPAGATGPLPVVLYTHGAGWVFGDSAVQDGLVQDLTAQSGAAIVLVEYDHSPGVRYPIALEQVYAALDWIVVHGFLHDLDATRIAVAGDSVGGNMTAALSVLAKQRGGPEIQAQLLYYPVTDASFDTDSQHSHWLRVDAPRDEPARAGAGVLSGLPPALVIVPEADVLRAEGEAYAATLRSTGVPVTAVRYQGIIHDFALRATNAVTAATAQAGEFLRAALSPELQTL
ncbi:acetyl esterase/lipase [Actinoplanes lutulentus]|uniref:Acetyl esterase/lipase n=1 Tax=Actinoplanes lutulentus TaxID=1287878 RepID=A0A327ZBL9_9ACTN|nr:alpha/beta hydrolase [Actinoplanes lutulentus]MBB2941458.1 acetyl esterase/lipase [Actinoplanes lutulentus]RAK36949.1 acetyl esterase/lipase [Actinoplanes lutulentus]